MEKKSEEYLRQYIKLTDNLKQKIEAHAARYHIKAEICAWYSDWEDFCSDWCDICGYSRTEARKLYHGGIGEFMKLPEGNGIVRFANCNKDAIVRLHHREGEELLFALTFRNDDTTVVLETENDNDMREEIQARFDAALEDGKDELDVYSEMLETGIDIKMVRKYLGDDAADHMKDFCKEHGLI